MHTTLATHPAPPRAPLLGPLLGLLLAASALLVAVLGANQSAAAALPATGPPGVGPPTVGSPPPTPAARGSAAPGSSGLGLDALKFARPGPTGPGSPSAGSAGVRSPSLDSAGLGPSGVGRSVERFQWPLTPPHPVLRPFQPPSTPYGPGHRGVDLGGRLGEPVLAAGSGLVLYAGPLADRSLVSIEHVGGLRTTYEPVQPIVHVGDHVERGQVIGLLLGGHPGCPAVAPAVCLHWGAHREAVYLDPLRLVESGHVRLLPWVS